MIKYLTIASVVLTASSLLAAAANANPVYLGYSTNGGTTITQFPGQPGNGNSSINNDAADVPGFTISFGATGSPALPMPNFFSNTLTIRSSAPGSIILYASEINITAVTGGFTSSFQNNGDSSASITESTYKDMSNTAFGLARVLSTAVLAPGMSSSTNASAFGTSTTYALTEVYSINFTAAGQIVDATIGLTGVPLAVPEPLSISLLGAGLAGLGIIRLRRKA